MKKIVLLALVAVTAFACKTKVAPVVEAPAPAVIDSIVMVEGLGEVVSEVFGNELAAVENAPAQTNKLMLHHQSLAKNGVFELTNTTKKEDGTDGVNTELGRWTLVEGGEFPIYELKAFGDNSSTFFWALKGDVLELLDADKLPLATPYTMMRYTTTGAAAPVAEVVEEVAPEAAPAN